MVGLWHCFTHIIHISWFFSQLQPNNAQLFQIPTDRPNSSNQWEFQDSRVEVLYHIRPYFVGKFPYIGLKNRPYIRWVPPIIRFLKWPNSSKSHAFLRYDIIHARDGIQDMHHLRLRWTGCAVRLRLRWAAFIGGLETIHGVGLRTLANGEILLSASGLWMGQSWGCFFSLGFRSHRGTPKSSLYGWMFHYNHPFWGIFIKETAIYIYRYIMIYRDILGNRHLDISTMNINKPELLEL